MFLDTTITIRIKKDVLKDLKAIYKHNRDRYDSIGHIIRASVNERIRLHKGNKPRLEVKK